MTGTPHLTEEIRLPTPLDILLAIIPNRQDVARGCLRSLWERAGLHSFDRMSEDDADSDQRFSSAARTTAGMAQRLRRIRRFSSRLGVLLTLPVANKIC